MRKIHFVFAQVLLFMLLAGMASSGWAANAPGYISLVASVSVTASGQQNTSRTPANVVSTADFTESQLGMKNGALALNSNGMWADSGKSYDWIQFDLRSIVNLDEVWIWGWNEAAGKQQYSWKNVIISYTDSDTGWSYPSGLSSGQAPTLPNVLGGAGKQWTLASPPCVAGAAASNLAADTANNIAAGQPIYFGGVAARYIRICKVNNQSGATGTSGLQRIRFYTPASQPYVSPTSFNFKTQFYNITSSPLTLGACSQFHPMELSTFTVTQAPGTPILVQAPTTLPKYQPGGVFDSYNIVFAPQFKGNYYTTITVNLTDVAQTNKYVIPVTAWAYSDEPTFIKTVTATSSSDGDSSHKAAKMTDNSGITEDNNVWGSRNAIHSQGGNNYWLSDNSKATTATWAQFDFGAAYPIRDMMLWNDNQTTSSFGIKTAYVFYKVNSTDAWTTLGGGRNTFTFAKAAGTGPISATNLVGGTSVDFGGVTARYVQLQPAGVKGIGNWSSTDDNVGIAEVRFYKTTTNPVARWKSFE